MRYFILALIVGVAVGVLYFRAREGAALTCSDIERTYDSKATACQQTGNFDDTTTNKYKNNHASDDVWIAIAVTPRTNIASYQVLSPNAYWVENGQTTGNLTVTGIRIDDCDETKWTTNASLSGTVCSASTGLEHVFDNICCDL